MTQHEETEVRRRGTRHQIDQDVRMAERLYADWQLVGKIADRFRRTGAELQLRIVPVLQALLEITHEVPPLVHRRSEPGELSVVEHCIERHHALDEASVCCRLAKAAVRLANRLPERFVVDVEHPAAVQLSGGDGRRESPLDQ